MWSKARLIEEKLELATGTDRSGSVLQHQRTNDGDVAVALWRGTRPQRRRDQQAERECIP
jgi:hypothetical protein